LKQFLFPRDVSRAKIIQSALKDKVRINHPKKMPNLIAGVDAAFLDDSVIGTACLFRYPELDLIDEASATRKVFFPYIPGFLSFREGPAIIAALMKLKRKPDVVLFDGQGIAHPQGLGIASHIGVLLDTPSIGCAKSRLVGDFRQPGVKKGKRSRLMIKDMLAGAVLRTREKTSPVFVSPGHRIDLPASIEIVLKCCTKFRIPEPLRRADMLSKKIRKLLVKNHNDLRI
jgi:deoxyribonuclease V